MLRRAKRRGVGKGRYVEVNQLWRQDRVARGDLMVTKCDGKLNVGDFAFVRRNPFKYFDNPNLELSREQVESKLKDWDFDERTCVIAGLQENIEIPIALEDVRG